MFFTEALAYILNIPKFTSKNTPDNTERLLKKLQNPEKTMKIIHVAGTNGKGSVCAFISSVLKENGYKVGLFTSPHLTDIKERFRINGQVIENTDFLEAFHKVKEAVDSGVREGCAHPTFFEFLFLMSLVIFKRKDVRFAVLETGLGGRLDATNVIKKPIVTVITSIGYDHTEYLGNTLCEIANEKAGIIKKGVPVIFDASKEEVNQVIISAAKLKNSKCIPVTPKDYQILEMDDKSIDFSINYSYYESNSFHLKSPAVYQVMNAVLAIKTLEEVSEKYIIQERSVSEGIKNTVWPGRMEEIAPNIFVDGAHNVEGIRAFIESADRISKGKGKYLLFSAVSDKNYKAMIKCLVEGLDCEKYGITKLQGSRAISLEDMYGCFQELTDKSIFVYENCEAALENIRKGMDKDSLLFCVGSLYLVGELKKLIGRIKI